MFYSQGVPPTSQIRHALRKNEMRSSYRAASSLEANTREWCLWLLKLVAHSEIEINATGSRVVCGGPCMLRRSLLQIKVLFCHVLQSKHVQDRTSLHNMFNQLHEITLVYLEEGWGLLTCTALCDQVEVICCSGVNVVMASCPVLPPQSKSRTHDCWCHPNELENEPSYLCKWLQMGHAQLKILESCKPSHAFPLKTPFFVVVVVERTCSGCAATPVTLGGMKVYSGKRTFSSTGIPGLSGVTRGGSSFLVLQMKTISSQCYLAMFCMEGTGSAAT